jgi:hypothetical protein
MLKRINLSVDGSISDAVAAIGHMLSRASVREANA